MAYRRGEKRGKLLWSSWFFWHDPAWPKRRLVAPAAFLPVGGEKLEVQL